jgi:hypothetical protein
MNLRDRRQIEPEAGIGGDHDVDLAAELALQHCAPNVAAGELADRIQAPPADADGRARTSVERGGASSDTE